MYSTRNNECKLQETINFYNIYCLKAKNSHLCFVQIIPEAYTKEWRHVQFHEKAVLHLSTINWWGFFSALPPPPVDCLISYLPWKKINKLVTEVEASKNVILSMPLTQREPDGKTTQRKSMIWEVDYRKKIARFVFARTGKHLLTGI